MAVLVSSISPHSLSQSAVHFLPSQFIPERRQSWRQAPLRSSAGSISQETESERRPSLFSSLPSLELALARCLLVARRVEIFGALGFVVPFNFMEFEAGEMGQKDKVVPARQALRVGFSAC